MASDRNNPGMMGLSSEILSVVASTVEVVGEGAFRALIEEFLKGRLKSKFPDLELAILNGDLGKVRTELHRQMSNAKGIANDHIALLQVAINTCCDREDKEQERLEIVKILLLQCGEVPTQELTSILQSVAERFENQKSSNDSARLEIARLLLGEGANPSIRNQRYGQSIEAFVRQYPKLVAELRLTAQELEFNYEVFHKITRPRKYNLLPSAFPKGHLTGAFTVSLKSNEALEDTRRASELDFLRQYISRFSGNPAEWEKLWDIVNRVFPNVELELSPAQPVLAQPDMEIGAAEEKNEASQLSLKLTTDMLQEVVRSGNLEALRHISSQYPEIYRQYSPTDFLTELVNVAVKYCSPNRLCLEQRKNILTILLTELKKLGPQYAKAMSLQRLVARGDSEVVRLALEAGADIAQKNSEGKTLFEEVLHIINTLHGLETAKVLLEHGLTIFDKDLYELARRGNSEIVALLLQHGMTPEQGEKLLLCALNNDWGPLVRGDDVGRRKEIINLLLIYGVNPDVKQRNYEKSDRPESSVIQKIADMTGQSISQLQLHYQLTKNYWEIDSMSLEVSLAPRLMGKNTPDEEQTLASVKTMIDAYKGQPQKLLALEKTIKELVRQGGWFTRIKLTHKSEAPLTLRPLPTIKENRPSTPALASAPNLHQTDDGLEEKQGGVLADPAFAPSAPVGSMDDNTLAPPPYVAPAEAAAWPLSNAEEEKVEITGVSEEQTDKSHKRVLSAASAPDLAPSCPSSFHHHRVQQAVAEQPPSSGLEFAAPARAPAPGSEG